MMKVRNRHGQAIDPVPFLVVAGLSFLVLYSLLPLYLMAFGVSVAGGLCAATATWVWIALGAFHRLVWDYSPARREHVPVGFRFRRLVWGTVAGIALLVLLSLPLAAR